MIEKIINSEENKEKKEKLEKELQKIIIQTNAQKIENDDDYENDYDDEDEINDEDEIKGKVKLKTIILIGLLIIMIILLLLRIKIRTMKNESMNNVSIENKVSSKNTAPIDNSTVKFFTLKSYSGFPEDAENNKFKITSKEEIRAFNEIYQGAKINNTYDFSNTTVFIQTQVLSTGAAKIKINDFIINDTVKFDYETDVPKGNTTQEMAYWYLIAVVPNTKLVSAETGDWISPMSNNVKVEYTINIKSENTRLEDSLRKIIKISNLVGNCMIWRFNSDYKNNEQECTLVTYSEDVSDRIIEKINSTGDELKAVLYSPITKPELFCYEVNEQIESEDYYYQIQIYSPSDRNRSFD